MLVSNEQLEDFNIRQFQKDLVTWFEENKRDLPWRENQDPYRVWVSEIMLQQTRVDTVIPYYQQFMEKFPTIDALAEAEEQQVLKAWEGLGYYSRVRNLQTAVREVSEHYGGQVPDTKKEISKLKGVGPYTAGAILSIAYGKPEPAVDGNVMRVLSRILLIKEDIAKQKTRKLFEDVTTSLISADKPSEFNQGLMELGALICTPKSPGCLICPVQAHCRAYQEGIQEQLPVKAKKKKPKGKQLVAAVIENEWGQVLIHRRPSEGLLARLWEFPNTEAGSADQKQVLKDFLTEHYGVNVTVGKKVQTVEHVFSHLVWNISVYQTELLNEGNESDELRWVSKTEIGQYPFPVSHQKIIEQNVK
ncbi:A/G-specific adenine glycosylase [Desertibacillus haloalkaliphilus]|uniref:A/G-specific adenine glycosylase n=1 Tax=Desertibacillus haloalkaliphilus TaxID=1328930 RepID=UPI001C27FE4A|nr:A/G-specific adenine glycosylase [Desertibacillus haloalkaliphilus]MBU8908868.1 A/G-specific adenine glycosylase [Desertibacillus haloalkaliphilus]